MRGSILCVNCNNRVRHDALLCHNCGTDNKDRWNKIIGIGYICPRCGYDQCTIVENQHGVTRICSGKGGNCSNAEEATFTKDGIIWEDVEVKYAEEIKNPSPAFTQPIDPTPKCPTCGSNVVQKIGAMERGASIVGLGIFSRKINKSFKCKSCGHTW